VRSFRRVCQDNNIRIIKLHHIRHTVASLLKTPARDGQAILGHTRISTTLEIYTDVDDQARMDALTRLHQLLNDDEG
jgi:integrase